jgi:membrane protein YdbS with pleckstrin-like domain
MSIQLHNLRPDEKVDLVVRRHWIAFAFLAIYLLGWVFFTLCLFFMVQGIFVNLLIIVFWMYYLIFLYISWINYELDIFVFTNNRIICIEQKSFLNRAVAETTLDKIQEVNIETKGLLANIFDFGTLTIITAGSSPSFDMTYSPRPMVNARYINNLADKYRDHLFSGTKKQKLEWGLNPVSEQVQHVIQAGV